MKRFDLIGVWSKDCARDMQRGGMRLTFSAPFLGPPMMMDSVGGVHPYSSKFQIKDARRVTEDKIKFAIIADKETEK